MDFEQAKEIVKSNYPPENYTMLREALGWLLVSSGRVKELEEEIEILTQVITNSSHADELQVDYARLKGAEPNDDQS